MSATRRADGDVRRTDAWVSSDPMRGPTSSFGRACPRYGRPAPCSSGSRNSSADLHSVIWDFSQADLLATGILFVVMQAGKDKPSYSRHSSSPLSTLRCVVLRLSHPFLFLAPHLRLTPHQHEIPLHASMGVMWLQHLLSVFRTSKLLVP